MAASAAVIPTSTTTTGLTNTAVLDLVSLMGPTSASSAVFSRAVQTSFEGVTSITVPTFTESGIGFAFIVQGAPAPIRQMLFSAPTLTTKKVGAGWTMTRELMEGSNVKPLPEQQPLKIFHWASIRFCSMRLPLIRCGQLA